MKVRELAGITVVFAISVCIFLDEKIGDQLLNSSVAEMVQPSCGQDSVSATKVAGAEGRRVK